MHSSLVDLNPCLNSICRPNFGSDLSFLYFLCFSCSYDVLFHRRILWILFKWGCRNLHDLTFIQFAFTPNDHEIDQSLGRLWLSNFTWCHCRLTSMIFFAIRSIVLFRILCFKYVSHFNSMIMFTKLQLNQFRFCFYISGIDDLIPPV